jgi:geranylgeranyl pyrophosphate synthase
MREGVYNLPVLYALQDEEKGELAALLADGPLEGERLSLALDIVRADGSLGRAREAVTLQVRRARSLAEGLAEGLARDALVQLAEYLAVRCGADL